MIMIDFEKLKLFITGPIYISDKIKQAALLPEFGHRDKENAKRLEPILKNLKKIAGIEDNNNSEDYEIALIPGSGSNALETSIKSMVKDDDVILNVSVGAFGDLYYNIAKKNGKNAISLKFEPGEAIDIAKLKDVMLENKPDVVAFTHNETSTGVMNDIVLVGNTIKNTGKEYGKDVMVLVDGVSIFGGIDLKLSEAQVDVYSTATQKAIGTDAGIGIIIFNKKAVKKAETVENRGYVTDMLAHAVTAAKYQILSTPNCSVINQLYVQTNRIVNEIGVAKRFGNHKEMRDYTLKWVENLEGGFVPFAPVGYQSVSLTCLKVPLKYTIDDLKAVKEKLRAKGYLMDPGYGKMNKMLAQAGKNLTIRIGHMGDITLDMLKIYLDDLKEELELFKNKEYSLF